MSASRVAIDVVPDYSNLIEALQAVSDGFMELSDAAFDMRQKLEHIAEAYE